MNQPTIMNKPIKMNHLTRKTKKQQKAKPEGFTKAKKINSRGSLRDPEFTCAFNVGSSITINVSLSALFNFLFLCVDFNGDITWVLYKKPKKQQKAKPEGFTKAKTKNSRTETVSVPPKTPEKSINMSFSNIMCGFQW
jgi:hypothetical protein